MLPLNDPSSEPLDQILKVPSPVWATFCCKRLNWGSIIQSSGVGPELVSGDFPNQNGWLPSLDAFRTFLAGSSDNSLSLINVLAASVPVALPEGIHA